MSEYRRFLMKSSMKNSSWDIEWKSGESIPNGISTTNLVANSAGDLVLSSTTGNMRCDINLYSNCEIEIVTNIIKNTNAAFVQLELLSAYNKGGKLYFDTGGNIKAGGSSTVKTYLLGDHTIKGQLKDGYVTYWVDGELFDTVSVYSSQYLTVNGLLLQKNGISESYPATIKSFKYRKL